MKAVSLGRKLGSVGPFTGRGIDYAKNGDDPDSKLCYPDVYLHDAPEALHDLPDSGKATIEYKIVRRATDETKDDDGNKNKAVHLSLEILSILPDKDKDSLDETPGDAIQKWARKKEK